MPVSTLVPVWEYLTTDYSPDCDYVDGELVERNVGEKDHGKIQWALLSALKKLEGTLNIFVSQEQRVQVSPTRYRVPDICVLRGGEPDEQIFTTAPFLCIEILSPEDRMARIMEKINDYLGFGVSYIWVIDPKAREGYVYTTAGMTQAAGGVLRTENPAIGVRLGELIC